MVPVRRHDRRARVDAGRRALVRDDRGHSRGAAMLQNGEAGVFPFGKEVVYGGGGFSFLVNLIWIVLFGWEMALGYVALGLVWCVTIVGIPVGLQCFKMAKLALMPFGAEVD